jgi:DNA-binding NarL/FixJ family response regulator
MTNPNPKPPRKYTVWHLTEERYLRTLLWRGASTEQIAERLGRTERAIRARMQLLARQDDERH